MSIPFLIVLLVSGLAFVGNLHFSMAQSGTNVTGIISLDTTWTQANSPYTLTGPVLVNNGVTLTMEAGVTVNLTNYYIEVNGTLKAIGTSTKQIHFINGTSNLDNPIYSITFTPFSSIWNEQSGKGCIIENTILSSTTILIDSSSPKIDNNNIEGYIRAIGNGNTIILKNKIIGAIEDESSATTIISNNTITSPTVQPPDIYGISSRNHNSITVSNNTKN